MTFKYYIDDPQYASLDVRRIYYIYNYLIPRSEDDGSGEVAYYGGSIYSGLYQTALYIWRAGQDSSHIIDETHYLPDGVSDWSARYELRSGHVVRMSFDQPLNDGGHLVGNGLVNDARSAPDALWDWINDRVMAQVRIASLQAFNAEGELVLLQTFDGKGALLSGRCDAAAPRTAWQPENYEAACQLETDRPGVTIERGAWGRQRITGSPQDDELSGASGRDVFVVGPGSGHDVIHDFTPNQDVLEIGGGQISLWRELPGLLEQRGDDVVLTLADSSVTLKNVALADLDADDFSLFP
ncbi:hypothetical protein ACERNI_12060 [Camelimonas sp. ID_303_24]